MLIQVGGNKAVLPFRITQIRLVQKENGRTPHPHITYHNMPRQIAESPNYIVTEKQ